MTHKPFFANLNNCSDDRLPSDYKCPEIERMIRMDRIIAEHKDDPYNAAGIIFNETAKLFADEGRSRIFETRTDIVRIVEMLRTLHLNGMVARIDGVPTAAEVSYFNFNRLGDLIVDLRERYFPTEEVFNTA